MLHIKSSGRNKKVKKSISLLLSVLLIFILAACQPANTDSDADLSNSSSQTSAIESESVPSDSSDGSDASSNNAVSSVSSNTATKPSESSSEASSSSSNITNTDSSSGTSEEESEEENMSYQLTSLSNTWAKIKNGESLNVAFIGGSITDGTGSTNSVQNGWPKLVCDWLTSEYNITVTENRKSIGGTGSYLGAMRLEKEAFSDGANVPDLLFVDFAINDIYLGYTYDQCVRYTESIVRKAYELNSEMEIVFVLSFDKNFASADFSTLIAHRDVAEEYGLAHIKIGEEFFNIVSEAGGNVSNYLADSVHPNDEGYKIYAQIITEKLSGFFDEAEKAHGESGANEYVCRERQLPSTSLSNYFKNPTLVLAGDIDLSQGTGWRYFSRIFSWVSMERFPGLVTAGKAGYKLVFEFEGTEFGMFYHMKPNMGSVSVYIDGEYFTSINAYLSYSNPREAVIAENLEYGKHTVEIDMNDGLFEIGALMYS